MNLAFILSLFSEYKQVVFLLAFFVLTSLLMLASYNHGVSVTNEQWKAKETEYQIDRLKEIREYEAKEEERQNLIIADFQKQLEDLKKVQASEVAKIIDEAGSTISDTVSSVCHVRNELNRVCNCSDDHKPNNPRGLSKTQNNSERITCYTTDQLRRKIAQSVAIGQECDREMMRFKALIETCKGE